MDLWKFLMRINFIPGGNTATEESKGKVTCCCMYLSIRFLPLLITLMKTLSGKTRSNCSRRRDASEDQASLLGTKINKDAILFLKN